MESLWLGRNGHDHAKRPLRSGAARARLGPPASSALKDAFTCRPFMSSINFALPDTHLDGLSTTRAQANDSANHAFVRLSCRASCATCTTPILCRPRLGLAPSLPPRSCSAFAIPRTPAGVFADARLSGEKSSQYLIRLALSRWKASSSVGHVDGDFIHREFSGSMRRCRRQLLSGRMTAGGDANSSMLAANGQSPSPGCAEEITEHNTWQPNTGGFLWCSVSPLRTSPGEKR